MAQYEDTFTCFLESEKKNEIEHRLCVEAMIEGIKSGLFDVVAHPDRCFKRQKEWTEELTKLSNRLFFCCLRIRSVFGNKHKFLHKAKKECV